MTILDAPREMLLRHWQNVVRGLNILDRVLRRRESLGSRSPNSQLSTGRSDDDAARSLSMWKVLAVVLVCGPVYGIAMGSYAAIVGERTLSAQLPQMFYSGIKVPLLIAVTVGISLPSFFVINTLMGLRNDFRESLQAVISAQAGLTIILVSLFPLTLFSYISFAAMGASYQLAVLFNAGMFGLASVSAQILLRGYYRPLIQRNHRHRWMVRMWVFVFAFVGIQAAYVLRPFIGNPATPPSFFREESFGNAYVTVFELVREVILRIAGS